MTLEATDSKNLEITTIPNEDIEELTYTSSDTNIVTVDDNGKVTGVAKGTATVTVTGKTTTSVSGTCIVTVKGKSMTVTPEQIAANLKIYYGARVTNYTKGAEYRIFYVDTSTENNGAGKYGDGTNTVYLIADYSDDRKTTLGTGRWNSHEYSASDTAQNRIYMEENKSFWIASPHPDPMCVYAIKGSASVSYDYANNFYGIRPIVSLKSTTPIKIEL